MSRKCAISGKKPMAGNNVSHAHNKTRRWQRPNVQTKRLFVPELKRFIRIKVSTSAIRTINKMGLLPYLRKEGLQLKDIT
jgi:large subunit ribosomal protein L28